MFLKPCLRTLLASGCSGDSGLTDVLYRGVLTRDSKDSDVVKFYGALDVAIAYANSASLAYRDARRRVLRLVTIALMATGFYVNTGNPCYLELATAMLRRALLKLAPYVPDAPVSGWVLCRSRRCAEVDKARVWVRWAERRAVALGEREAAAMLNRISNVLFEVMRSEAHTQVRLTCPLD